MVFFLRRMMKNLSVPISSYLPGVQGGEGDGGEAVPGEVARVVHEDVEAAELRHGGGHGGLALGLHTHVAAEADDLARPRLQALRLHSLQRGQGAAQQGQPGMDNT